MATIDDFTPVLAEVISNLPQAVILVDADNQIHFVNQGAASLFAYEREELVGTALDALMPEMHRERHRQHVKRFVEGNHVDRHPGGEIRLLGRRKDGREFSADASLTRLAVPGTPAMALIILTDTSARIADMDRLLLRSLDSISDPILIMNSDWRYSYVNMAGASFVGRGRNELLGQNIWELSPWLRETDFGKACLRAMKGGDEFSLENYYKPRDRWLMVHYFPGPDGFTVLIGDINELKQMQQRVSELLSDTASIEHMHALFDVMPSPMFMVDSELRYTYANIAALSIHNRTREQMIGTRMWELNPPLKDSELVRRCREAFRTGQRQQFEQFLPPSGRWMQVDTIPLGGQIILAAVDITKQKQSEKSVGILTDTLEQVIDGGWARKSARDPKNQEPPHKPNKLL